MTQWLLRKSLVCMCMYVIFDTIIYRDILTKCVSNSAPRLDTLLFEHAVEPIVTYGCEIWGTVISFLSSKVKKANFKLENLL